MKTRLVVITEIIAPYRIPVFNALAQEPGIDLHVIFLSETDPGLRDWHIYLDEIAFSYEVLPSWRRRLGAHNVLLNQGLRAALNHASPDVVVCGGYNYLASWQAMAWARRSHTPFLLWIESTLQDQRSGKIPVEFLKKKFVEGCDGFIVPGTSSREYVRGFGVPDENISTAPNAVANEVFSARASAAVAQPWLYRKVHGLPSRFLLFVGRLVPEKGVRDLVQAYEALCEPLRAQLSLVIVGDGPLRQEIETRAARLVTGRINVAGFVQRDDLAAYYGLAEMFVFPTRTDPWGLVVNEAMACGLPVIASSAAGCVSDLVRNEWNGCVVCPGDVGELGAAITRLAHDPELRRAMGNRSLELISRHSPMNCAAGIAAATLNCAVATA
ncbi:MAG TPA: glycosyltransferase family 4 protein [Terriglobales bacterium]|nr:glycosyltransferase family 4 protein [Terriglobales bacterium]